MAATSGPRVRPFPFDRVDRVAHAQVAAGRALLAHIPLVDAATMAVLSARLGGPVELRFQEAYAFPARELLGRLPGPPPSVLIRIAAPAGRSALIVLDAVLAARIASWLLEASSGGSTPPAPRPIVATALSTVEQRALAEIIDPLLAFATARVDGFPVDEAELFALFPDPSVLCVDARLRTPLGDGFVRVCAPDRIRLRPPLPRSSPPSVAHRARLDGARVELAMEIGRTLIARSDFAGIAVGDVILFDEFGPRPPLGGPLVLRVGRGAIRAWLDGEGLTVVKGFELGAARMEPSPMEDQPPAVAGRDDNSTDALLAALPVEVVCELGRVSISARELVELRPGAVIPVGRPLAGPVDLTVGGRVVARGELVDVEGEIGVRLTQVSD